MKWEMFKELIVHFMQKYMGILKSKEQGGEMEKYL